MGAGIDRWRAGKEGSGAAHTTGRSRRDGERGDMMVMILRCWMLDDAGARVSVPLPASRSTAEVSPHASLAAPPLRSKNEVDRSEAAQIITTGRSSVLPSSMH